MRMVGLKRWSRLSTTNAIFVTGTRSIRSAIRQLPADREFEWLFDEYNISIKSALSGQHAP